MPDYLLDTNILIRHLRRHQPTTDLMAALTLNGEVGISTITRIEMIQGMREHERTKTLELLNSLTPYDLDSAIADLSGEYIRHYQTQGMTLAIPDAVIAATAMRHKLILVTYNAKHFPMPELRLYKELPS